ncbi:VOC family protein [Haloarchaeobius sp. HRN-SO-5]|uniref:VOC family protein n=1 Tax=Haloarchaeobius sp. HRN-SO-5 TaxID=3446118 RepID=UPI003EB97B52
MDLAVPELAIEAPAISQIAWVVADLDEAMERYRRVLGFGPWEVHHVEPPEHRDMFYDGEKTECSFAIGYTSIGDLEVEFIEPTSGKSVHQDFLDEHGEGIHHIACFEFEDTPAVMDAFDGAGIPIVQRGQWHDRDYIYFDTTDHLDGLYFETLMGGEEDLEPSYVYPDSTER